MTVVLRSMPPLAWGKGKDCTFGGALEAALAVTNHPCDYATLMGATALAFRTRWWQAGSGRGWCPSSPVGEFPEEIQAAREATGWQLRQEAEYFGRPSNPGMDLLIPRITASINAGLPVVAYDEGCNMAVIQGYADEGRTVLIRDYSGSEAPKPMELAKLPWFLILLGEHSEPLAPLEALRASLATAARNFERPPVSDNGGAYAYGLHALTSWADDVARADTLSDDERGSLFFVSWWNMECLLDARQAGIAYLRGRSALLSGEAGEALLRAADCYEQEVSLLQGALATNSAFLGLCSGKTLADWTPAVMCREHEVLLKAGEAEASAVQEFRSALA